MGNSEMNRPRPGPSLGGALWWGLRVGCWVPLTLRRKRRATPEVSLRPRTQGYLPRTQCGKRDLAVDPAATHLRPVLPQEGAEDMGLGGGRLSTPIRRGRLRGLPQQNSGRRDYGTGPFKNILTGTESNSRHGCGVHHDGVL